MNENILLFFKPPKMKIIIPVFVTLLLTGILAHAQTISPNRYNVVGAVQTGPGAEGGAVGTIEVFKNKTATLKFLASCWGPNSTHFSF